jgi:polyisoprenoid-binding protein YceI
MKKIYLFAILMAQLSLFSCKSSTDENTLKLDKPAEIQEAVKGERFAISPEKSEVIWEGKKLVRKHHGTIGVKGGFVMMDKGRLTGGELTINMNSIVDLSQTGSSKEKLEGHLKSDDFFDVNNHPTAGFTVTKTASYLGDEGINTLIYGNLTIKGITKSTQFKANVVSNGDQINIQAPMFTFDRAEFDIRYDSASFFDDLGDSAIDDDIGLSVSLVATK